MTNTLLGSLVHLGQLAQTGDGGGGGGIAGAIFALIWLTVVIGSIAGMWMTFSKAGQPGWGCLIPIYNMYLLLQVAGKPGWWLILMLIPFVNFIVIILVSIDVARAFGRGVGFGLGLVFLGFIFYPILGFGSDQYVGADSGAAMARI